MMPFGNPDVTAAARKPATVPSPLCKKAKGPLRPQRGRTHAGHMQTAEAPIQESRIENGRPTMHDNTRAGVGLAQRSPCRVRVTDWLPSAHIDGAWWPRSTDLVDELPTLLSTLADRLGRIAAVGYDRNGWAQVPPQLDVAGETIELMGFDGAEPASLIVIGHEGHHLTLRVIHPSTSPETACQELDAVPERAVMAGGPPSPTARSMANLAHRLAQHEGRDDDQRTAEIMRWCQEAEAQFNEAPIQSFVPVLVEHIVANRMYRSRAQTRSLRHVDTANGSRRHRA
jgi:hypothetical protein